MIEIIIEHILTLILYIFINTIYYIVNLPKKIYSTIKYTEYILYNLEEEVTSELEDEFHDL